MAVAFDLDVDGAAIGLGGALVVPGVEARAALQHVHLRPTRRQQSVAHLGDGRILQAPERIGVGEVALLAEQVGDDGAVVLRLVEQRGAGGDLGAAEQPRLELPRRRRLLLGIGRQRQPCFLPFPGGQRQQVQGCGVDLASAIEAADVGIELGQRQAPSDDLLGKPKWRRFRPRPGLCAQPGEGLVLVHLVHRQALDVLGQRGLDGGGVIVGGQHHAGQRIGLRCAAAPSLRAAR